MEVRSWLWRWRSGRCFIRHAPARSEAQPRAGFWGGSMYVATSILQWGRQHRWRLRSASWTAILRGAWCSRTGSTTRPILRDHTCSARSVLVLNTPLLPGISWIVTLLNLFWAYFGYLFRYYMKSIRILCQLINWTIGTDALLVFSYWWFYASCGLKSESTWFECWLCSHTLCHVENKQVFNPLVVTEFVPTSSNRNTLW